MAAQQQPWEFLFREVYAPLSVLVRGAQPHPSSLCILILICVCVTPCSPAPLPLQAVAAHERAEKRQVPVCNDCYVVLLHPHTLIASLE
jgi:hypothetical protein